MPAKKPDIVLSPGEIDKIREEGRVEGLQQGRQEMLEWLEHVYLDDPGRPDRGTPKAEAILEIAKAAGKFMRKGGNTPRLKP